MENKKPWESRTLWINAAIAAGVTIWNVVAPTLDATTVALATAAANVLMRFITRKGISL